MICWVSGKDLLVIWWFSSFIRCPSASFSSCHTNIRYQRSTYLHPLSPASILVIMRYIVRFGFFSPVDIFCLFLFDYPSCSICLPSFQNCLPTLINWIDVTWYQNYEENEKKKRKICFVQKLCNLKKVVSLIMEFCEHLIDWLVDIT